MASDDPVASIRDSVCARTAKALRQGKSFNYLLQLMHQFDEEGERLDLSAKEIQSRAARVPGRPGENACRAGCAWCCHVQVAVSPLELLRIVAFLEHNLSASDRESITESVLDLDARTRGLGWQEREESRLPCALLKDGRCIVYRVRPARCRAWSSADSETCRAAYERPEAGIEVAYHHLQRAIYSAIQDGL
ncbi:MAG: YkgJ family cysteine cluster protein, partial [Bacteroidota bacterium]